MQDTQIFPHPNSRRFPHPYAGDQARRGEPSAHERARQARDLKAAEVARKVKLKGVGPPGKRGGPGNAEAPKNSEQLGGQLDITNTESERDRQDKHHVCDHTTCSRLPDLRWFAMHPRARSRLRDGMPGDDIAAGQMLVTRKGKRTISKIYIGGGVA